MVLVVQRLMVVIGVDVADAIEVMQGWQMKAEDGSLLALAPTTIYRPPHACAHLTILPMYTCTSFT